MRDETGGIVTGWLFQIVVIMAIIAFIGFEVITIALTTINLDDDARDVAITARDAYRDGRSLRAAEEAGAAAAEALGAQLVSVEADDTDVTVTVTDVADTLLLDRIGVLDTVTHPTATARAPWRG